MNTKSSSRETARIDKQGATDERSRGETRNPPLPAGDGIPDVREIGGPKGPEPTRYGDWERKGRCIDF
ncbi:MAG: DUF1674 domain-containing protein [Gammaproteobacteria bacterium]|nr:DUF1674 domain-containing protein [Gammaproteobacteria bacterium]